jgi:hypothetical protein
MNGHPALAYVVALQQLDERRRLEWSREIRTAPKSRSLRLGAYRLTLTKEGRHV